GELGGLSGRGRVLRSSRSGLMRTTAPTSPTRPHAEINQAGGARCHPRRPGSAEVGKAGWLLCHASPSVDSASQERLRDSSSVGKRRRPKYWHSELMEKVAWGRQ